MISLSELEIGDVVADPFGVEWTYVGGHEFRRDEGVSKIVDHDILINWRLKETQVNKLKEDRIIKWGETEKLMNRIGSGYDEIAYRLESGELIKIILECRGDSAIVGIAQQVKCCPTCNRDL